jgi:DNA-directed RNA polymerase specialized sigma24 family protein
MGAARWERPGGDLDEQAAADAAASLVPADRPTNEALRSWLLRGIHTFSIDPRRLGGRGQARRVLGEDRRLAPGAVAGWLDLVAALQRQTIHDALSYLSAAEREVVTLAYLEGHTNARIAAMLGVSVSTVRRRLGMALENLDEHARRAGTWVSAILLLGLLSAVGHAARLGRLAGRAAAADWPHKLAAGVAVGTVTAGVVGLVAANNIHSTVSKHSPPVATAPLTASLPSTTRSSSLIRVMPLTPSPAAPSIPVTAAVPLTHRSVTKPATAAAKVDSDADSEQSEREDQTVNETDRADQKDHKSPVVTEGQSSSQNDQ